MSEELEWELYDIFASGIFAFPVYEHNSARRIVRYLLMRGVPDEDVAAAIEDHPVDLRSWLERRPGHHMVGEWVMAWLNDSRDQYKADRRDRRLVYRLRHHRAGTTVGVGISAGSRRRHPDNDRSDDAAADVVLAADDDHDSFYDDEFPAGVARRRGSRMDAMSGTTGSTTSSDETGRETDDDDVGDDDDDVSASYRSSNNAASSQQQQQQQRKLSQRGGSSQDTVATTHCCRLIRRRASAMRRKDRLPAAAVPTDGNSGSGTVGDDDSDDDDDGEECSSSDVADCEIEDDPDRRRRTTGSDGDLPRRAVQPTSSSNADLRRHHVSRSCPHLTAADAVDASPWRRCWLTPETAADADWKQSRCTSNDDLLPFPIALTSSSFPPPPPRPPLPLPPTAASSMSSHCWSNRPPSLEIASPATTEFLTADGGRAGRRRARTVSSNCSATTSAGVERDSLSEPPDRGNASDAAPPCACASSVCCGGGVGAEHNCSTSTSPVGYDDEDDCDELSVVDQSPMTSFPDEDDVVVAAGGEYGSRRRSCDCDRCLYSSVLMPPPRYDVVVRPTGTGRAGGGGGGGRRCRIGYSSTFSWSASCRRSAHVEPRPGFAVDARWLPPMHDSFPVS